MVNAFLAEKTGKFWVIDSICFLVPVYLFIVLYTNERIVDKSLTFHTLSIKQINQLNIYQSTILSNINTLYNYTNSASIPSLALSVFLEPERWNHNITQSIKTTGIYHYPYATSRKIT